MKDRRAYIIVAASVFVLFAAGGGAYQAGYRLNRTASMPFGIWRILPPPARPAEGSIVIFCMDDSPLTKMALARGYVGPGICPSHTEPLVKPVAAASGDIVTVGYKGIIINGVLQPDSVPLARDPKHRKLPALPIGRYLVHDGEFWVLSGYSPLSFDSRYYGPLSVGAITGTASPVWVW